MIFRVEGDAVRAVAGLSFDGHRFTLERGGTDHAAGQRTRYSAGRAIAEGAVVHLPDLATVPEAELPARDLRAFGARTVLVVPLLRRGRGHRGDQPARREVRPFTAQQIKLLETFADQAVIAIENARLFAGAGGAQPGADGGAGAADRHGRGAAGDRAAHRPARVLDAIADSGRQAVRHRPGDDLPRGGRQLPQHRRHWRRGRGTQA